MAELAESEMKLELVKIDREMKRIEATELAPEMEIIEMELKGAMIRTEMRSTETDVARLRVQHAKSRLEALKESDVKKEEKPEEKPAAVRLEFVEGSEVVVIRGSSEMVEKVRALIKSADELQKQ